MQFKFIYEIDFEGIPQEMINNFLEACETMTSHAMFVALSKNYGIIIPSSELQLKARYEVPPASGFYHVIYESDWNGFDILNKNTFLDEVAKYQFYNWPIEGRIKKIGVWDTNTVYA